MVKLTVIGHLGKDCLTNQINGKNVINFSVASSESWTDSSGNKQQKTTWVECAYWTDKTGITPFLKKGTQVYVEGSAEVRTWTGQDGKSGASLTCRILNVQLLGSKDDNQQQTQQPAQQQQQQNQSGGFMPANVGGGSGLPF